MHLSGVHFFRKASTEKMFAEYYDILLSQLSSRRYREILDIDSLKNSHAVFAILYDFIISKPKHDCKIVISQHCFTVYYNNADNIDQLLCALEKSSVDTPLAAEFTFHYSSVMPGFETGVIYQARPKYCYRMYMGTMALTDKEKQQLLEYVLRPENKMKLSSNATATLHRRWGRLYSGTDIYIDSYSEQHAVYLNLLFPGIIRKLSKIEKRINTSISGVHSGQNSSTNSIGDSLQAD
jgi:hypothetical protein